MTIKEFEAVATAIEIELPRAIFGWRRRAHRQVETDVLRAVSLGLDAATGVDFFDELDHVGAETLSGFTVLPKDPDHADGDDETAIERQEGEIEVVLKEVHHRGFPSVECQESPKLYDKQAKRSRLKALVTIDLRLSLMYIA
jgi:hypothetical protein